MRPWLVSLVLAAVLAAIAWQLPQTRRRLLYDVTHWDAVPSEPVPLRVASGPPLQPVPRTRVVVIDGLSAEVASELPALRQLCARGVTATVDVGFPTVSLPVEVELWSGLTQQQTGVVNRYERPLLPPLRGIPSQIADSVAIAEDHGWIARSLGFATTEPDAAGNGIADAAPDAWRAVWQDRAAAAVSSAARLVFVHILRVDTAGHRSGGASLAYRTAAREADDILARLLAADAGARWFVLSDHGHLPGGGHGGEERALRQVQGCVAGPGVTVAQGKLIHLVDVARAIAESTAAVLPPEARGRPLGPALALPLGPDDAVPAMPLGPGGVAVLVLAAGIVLTVMFARTWWLAPWWFVAACAALVIVRGEPTLSEPFIYKPAGRDMYLVWLPMIAAASAITWLGTRRAPLLRVAIGQLALPFAATAAALTACSAWPAVLGADVAPVVPRWTAYASPLLLMAAHGAAAVALAALATLVRRASGRPAPPAPPRSAPSAG